MMKTKLCIECNLEQTVDSFYKSSRMKDGRQPVCKSCSRLRSKKHYHENKQNYIDRAVNSKRDLYQWLQRIKENQQCQYCGETKYWRLEFHHPDPTVKDGSISRLISDHTSKNKIVAEINKCEIVCRNCHADIHWAPKE